MSKLIRRFEETDHAAAYAKYRPTYNGSGVVESILEYLWSSKEEKKLSLAVDVGCGQGQFTEGLVKYFDKIIGADISQSQIDEARKHNKYENVQYFVSEAEDLPVADNSVDLVTAAMALHWLDHPRFYKEVDRVLRPGGVVAAIGQSFYITIMNHPKQAELTEILKQSLSTILEEGYWHERAGYILDKYRAAELQPPYPNNVRNEGLMITVHTTVHHLFKYLETRSGVCRYLKSEKRKDPQLWNDTLSRFCEVGDCLLKSPITYKLDLVWIAGRKPAK